MSPDSFDRQEIPAPLSRKQLTDACDRLRISGISKPVLSLTGGEPLLHSDFLLQWLPGRRSSYKIYLETNGVRYDAMQQLAGLVDVVSMDIKLPSATCQQEHWKEHRLFLEAALGREVFVKAVVTRETDPEELRQAVRLVAEQSRTVPFIIQPASGMLVPPPDMLVAFQNEALGMLEDVRVVPQVHKVLLVP